MKATNLAQALTIFASYAPDVEIEHKEGRYLIVGYSEEVFGNMTTLSKKNLFLLGWNLRPDGVWYLPD